MSDQPLSATVLIRKAEVLRRVGVDNSTIARWLKKGEHGFPQPVIINPGATRERVAWIEAEIEAWLASRPRGPAAKPGPAVWAGRQRKEAAKRQAAKGPIIIRRPS